MSRRKVGRKGVGESRVASERRARGERMSRPTCYVESPYYNTFFRRRPASVTKHARDEESAVGRKPVRCPHVVFVQKAACQPSVGSVYGAVKTLGSIMKSLKKRVSFAFGGGNSNGNGGDADTGGGNTEKRYFQAMLSRLQEQRRQQQQASTQIKALRNSATISDIFRERTSTTTTTSATAARQKSRSSWGRRGGGSGGSKVTPERRPSTMMPPPSPAPTLFEQRLSVCLHNPN